MTAAQSDERPLLDTANRVLPATLTPFPASRSMRPRSDKLPVPDDDHGEPAHGEAGGGAGQQPLWHSPTALSSRSGHHGGGGEHEGAKQGVIEGGPARQPAVAAISGDPSFQVTPDLGSTLRPSALGRATLQSVCTWPRRART